MVINMTCTEETCSQMSKLEKNPFYSISRPYKTLLKNNINQRNILINIKPCRSIEYDYMEISITQL